MLMDEDGSGNDQVEVATLQVSPLFPCWKNQRLQTIPLAFKRERRKGNERRGGGRDKEGKIMEPAMRKGRKKWEEGEEKERNPERAGE